MKRIRNLISKNTGGAVRISLITGLASALTLGGMAVAEKAITRTNQKLDLRIDASAPVRNGGTLTSFAPVVKRVAPAVVKVNVSAKAKQLGAPPGWPFGNDPMLRRFFGEQRDPRGQMPKPSPRQGFGSGVLVTQDGYLLTNNHVVEEAEAIEVEMADHRKFTATLVGGDPKTDIAVLKIDAKDLPYAILGDSAGLEIGDVVLAIGNPFGIGQTVTQGIVSGVGRAHMGLEYEDFIQTDAAINPGNSGGALVDAAGRLIGINTAIISRGGGNDGIGFAVPVNLARHVLERIVNEGHVSRGYLGVRIQDVTPDLAKVFKLDKASGALIAEVENDGPAAKAGLEPGDIVTAFNGKPVSDSRELKLAVGQSSPRAKANLTVLRNGKEHQMTARLNPLKDENLAINAGQSATDDEGALKGMQVADLSESNRGEHRIPAEIKGVLITDVQPGTSVASAGLQSGDVILEINRHAVSDTDSAIALCKEKGDGITLLRVWRAGATRYVVVNEKPVS